jgi:formate-dependent nitrite reductase cytochrome c552 subunit
MPSGSPPQELVDKMLRDQQRFMAEWEAQEAADAEWVAAEMAAAQDARG